MIEPNFLRGARVYLSGSIDFVASRAVDTSDFTIAPQRWDNRRKQYLPNDNWLFSDLKEPKSGGPIRDAHER